MITTLIYLPDKQAIAFYREKLPPNFGIATGKVQTCGTLFAA